MSNRLKALDILFSVILAFVCFISVYAFLGFYYETNDEMQMELFFRGISVSEGSWDLYYWHRLSGLLLSKLYHWFPHVPWYGSMMCIALFISAIHFFIVIHKLILYNNYFKILFCVLFFLFILIENIITINFLRVTIVLSASALILYFVVYPGLNSIMKKSFFNIYIFCILLFAYQIRPEGGLLLMALSLLMTIPLFVMLIKLRKSIYIYYVLCACVIIIVLVFNLLNYSTERIDDEKVIPYIQYLQNISIPDFNQIKDDSLKVHIAARGYFWDDSVITQNFLQSITPKYSALIFLNTMKGDVFYRFFHIIYIFAKNNLPLAVSYLVVLYVLLANLINCKRYNRFLYVIISNIFFWLSLIFLSSAYKMPNRLLTPLLIFLLLYNCVLLFYQKNELIHIKKHVLIIFSLALLVAIAIFSYRTINKVNWLDKRCKNNTTKLYEIENRFYNNTIILSYDAISLFNGLDPFVLSPLTLKNKYVIHGWFNWYHSFRNQIKNLCGEPGFIHLMDFINSNQHVFVSSQRNVNNLSVHLDKFYDRNVEIDVIEPTDPYIELTYGYELEYYKIRYKLMRLISDEQSNN